MVCINALLLAMAAATAENIFSHPYRPFDFNYRIRPAMDLEPAYNLDLHPMTLTESPHLAKREIVGGGMFLLESLSQKPLVRARVGTPAQEIMCVLDTMSSDVLIFTQNGTVDLASRYYDYVHSETHNLLELSPFEYSGHPGFFATDTFELGGVNLTGTTLSIVVTPDLRGSCVIGLGPINGELVGSKMENGVVSPTYDNIPVLLRNRGLSNSIAYSIWRDLNNSHYSALFGGLDASRVDLPISVVPMVKNFEPPGKFNPDNGVSPLNIRVMLHNITLNLPQQGLSSLARLSNPAPTLSGNYLSSQEYHSQNIPLSSSQTTQLSTQSTQAPTSHTQGSTRSTANSNRSETGAASTHCLPLDPDESVLQLSFATAVLLSHNLKISYLPDTIVRTLANAMDMIYSSKNQAYYARCNIMGTITLSISGIQVELPLSDLIKPQTYYSSSMLTDTVFSSFEDGTLACMFSFLPQNSAFFVLGADILDKLYVVYDLENAEVGIGNLVQKQQVLLNDSLGVVNGTVLPLYSNIPSTVKAPMYYSTIANTTPDVSSVGHFPDLHAHFSLQTAEAPITLPAVWWLMFFMAYLL